MVRLAVSQDTSGCLQLFIWQQNEYMMTTNRDLDLEWLCVHEHAHNSFGYTPLNSKVSTPNQIINVRYFKFYF